MSELPRAKSLDDEAAAHRRNRVVLVTSDTELIELALSRMALEDDFGPRLVCRKGSLPAVLDLDFDLARALRTLKPHKLRRRRARTTCWS